MKLQSIIEALEKLEKKETLYINRPLINYEEFVDWAKSQGFNTTLDPNELHVTLIFSKTPVDWSKLTPQDDELVSTNEEGRAVEKLGDKGAIVLRFEDDRLIDRNQEILDAGAKSDFPSYLSHITITYDPGNVDIEKVEPYSGELVFGPEEFLPVDEDWKDKLKEK